MEDFFEKGFIRSFFSSFTVYFSVHDMVMNWLFLNISTSIQSSINFILLLIIAFSIVLFSSASSNIASFVSCSIQLVFVIFLLCHISITTSLSLSYLPIIYISQSYKRIHQKVRFYKFLF